MDIIDAILGAFSWAFGWLRDALHNAFSTVSGWVTDFARWITGQLHSLVDQLWGTLNAVWVYVAAASDWIQGVGKSILGTVWGWVRGAVAEAVNIAQGLRNDLFNWASGLFGWLQHLIDGTMSWINNVVNPFMAAVVRQITDWVWQYIVTLVRSWVDDLRGWAAGAVGWLTARVGDAWSWIDQAGGYVWGLVHGAEDWLAFVAKHSVSWFVSMWQWLVNRGSREVAEGVMAAVATDGGAVEDWMARFLSGLALWSVLVTVLAVVLRPRRH